MIMASHVIDRKLSPLPASLSHRMITELLRKKMGYQGVVITDDLSMGAVTKRYDAPGACVQAVKAGDDLLLGVTQIDSSADAVVSAVKRGEISEKRIDRSVRRILRLKAERGIWKVNG